MPLLWCRGLSLVTVDIPGGDQYTYPESRLWNTSVLELTLEVPVFIGFECHARYLWDIVHDFLACSIIIYVLTFSCIHLCLWWVLVGNWQFVILLYVCHSLLYWYPCNQKCPIALATGLVWKEWIFFTFWLWLFYIWLWLGLDQNESRLWTVII